jgi:hypothetical protein
MKALDWQAFLSEQRARHGKVIFSVAELANVAQTSLHNLNTELSRLVRRGLLARYAHARYGAAQGVRTEDLVPAIDSAAYLTGFYGVFRHHLVTQAPSEVTCFTNRRHNRRNRVTPAGKLKFVCVPDSIYSKPTDGVLVAPEQALCDFVWLSVREGLDPRSLVTFRNLERLGTRRLNIIRRRYPDSVQRIVGDLVGG